jgi:hypothetical protein
VRCQGARKGRSVRVACQCGGEIEEEWMEEE